MAMKIIRKTHNIDATDMAVGRLAVKVALLLRGKGKTSFRANVDGGDFVNIENGSKVKFTGKKFFQKQYFWHSFHPGGMKRPTIQELFTKNPKEVIRRAVRGMLPKNKSRDKIIKRLKVAL